ncbi:hypothetical protein CDAR_190631, partial [Caerostris darwini]
SRRSNKSSRLRKTLATLAATTTFKLPHRVPILPSKEKWATIITSTLQKWNAIKRTILTLVQETASISSVVPESSSEYINSGSADRHPKRVMCFAPPPFPFKSSSMDSTFPRDVFIYTLSDTNFDKISTLSKYYLKQFPASRAGLQFPVGRIRVVPESSSEYINSGSADRHPKRVMCFAPPPFPLQVKFNG